MRTKLVASIGAGIVGAVLVVGCSNDSTEASMDGHSMGSMSSMPSTSESSTTSAQFDDADVMFAQMMYPHHAQAVEMADMTDGRTDNPDVLSLASAIAGAQKPEMDQLTGFLSAWGQPAPSSDMGAMDGMDHSSGSGMMSRQDMDSLTTVSGAEFDRQWLTMMIAHHTGAIEMANREIADGSNPDAQNMARSIASTQQQEIRKMQRLLG